MVVLLVDHLVLESEENGHQEEDQEVLLRIGGLVVLMIGKLEAYHPIGEWVI